MQAKFSIKEPQARFLSKYKEYGFKDKSTMLRIAIDHYRKTIEIEQLKQSANVYAEIYAEDEELKSLTDTALDGWPE